MSDPLPVLELLWLALALLLLPFVGGFYLGRALPTRFAVATFGVGTALIAFLAYRWYQSQVDYCRDLGPGVDPEGGKLSCLDAGNWAAYNAGNLVLLLAELGLATLLVVGLVRWGKQRRHRASSRISPPRRESYPQSR